MSSLLWRTAVSSRAGTVTLDSQAPIATLASSTMELNCAGEAWRTLLASVSDRLIVDDLFLSSSLLCWLSLNKRSKDSFTRTGQSNFGGDTCPSTSSVQTKS